MELATMLDKQVAKIKNYPLSFGQKRQTKFISKKSEITTI